ncbi:hypothetical protein SPLC1_S206680 [Arthrospira platensis C1]|nr:hypothetical protein SPLC1_S206680 [Arthrospira platensis C1]
MNLTATRLNSPKLTQLDNSQPTYSFVICLAPFAFWAGLATRRA